MRLQTLRRRLHCRWAGQNKPAATQEILTEDGQRRPNGLRERCSSSVLAFCLMIWSWSAAKASADTSVAGVPSGKSPWQGASTATLALVESTTSVRGFTISLSTLSGLNGNKSHAANPAKMFLRVNALSLAGLHSVVKCFLSIAFTPPRSQTLDLFSISSLQWREHGYVARLKLVGGVGRDTTEYYVVLKAELQDLECLMSVQVVADQYP